MYPSLPSRSTTISGNSTFVGIEGNNNRWVQWSLNVVLEWIKANFRSPDPITQIITPSDGATDQVDNPGSSTWLLLRPPANLSTYTIILDAIANVTDGQELIVTSTRQIAALTILANGATAVNGAPSSVGADSGFRLRFDSITKEWYRIR